VCQQRDRCRDQGDLEQHLGEVETIDAVANQDDLRVEAARFDLDLRVRSATIRPQREWLAESLGH
jgi:hypothetical protein